MMTAITTLPQKKRDLPAFCSSSSESLAAWSNPEESAITTQVNPKVHIGDFCNAHINQYVFCGDNPVNYRDAFGLCKGTNETNTPLFKLSYSTNDWVWTDFVMPTNNVGTIGLPMHTRVLTEAGQPGVGTDSHFSEMGNTAANPIPTRDSYIRAFLPSLPASVVSNQINTGDMLLFGTNQTIRNQLEQGQ